MLIFSIVARSPSKLIECLQQRGISESITRDHLSVTEGTITDLDAVKRTIQPGGSGSPMVDIIISGTGGKLLFDSPLKPTLDNPTVCQDAVRTSHHSRSRTRSGITRQSPEANLGCA